MLRLARRTFRPDIRTRHGARTRSVRAPRKLHGGHVAGCGDRSLAGVGERRRGYERLCISRRRAARLEDCAEREPDWRAAITAAADVRRRRGRSRSRGRVRATAVLRATNVQAGQVHRICSVGARGHQLGRLARGVRGRPCATGQHIVVALEHGYGLPPGSLGCWRTALWSAVAGVPASAGTRTSRPLSRRAPARRSRATASRPSPGPHQRVSRARGGSPIGPRSGRGGGGWRGRAARGHARGAVHSRRRRRRVRYGRWRASRRRPGAGCVPRAGAGGDDRATLVGRILTPRSGERITSRVFYATGTLKGEIGGRHAWVAARVQAGFVPRTTRSRPLAGVRESRSRSPIGWTSSCSRWTRRAISRSSTGSAMVCGRASTRRSTCRARLSSTRRAMCTSRRASRHVTRERRPQTPIRRQQTRRRCWSRGVRVGLLAVICEDERWVRRHAATRKCLRSAAARGGHAPARARPRVRPAADRDRARARAVA